MARVPEGIEPYFLDEQTIVALHKQAIDRYGGLEGFDQQKIESIAAYPRHKHAYDSDCRDVPGLAGALAFAIAKEFHAFNDGNKRTALAAMAVFLVENEFMLTADSDEAEEVIESLAAGAIGLEDMLGWVRENSVAEHSNI